MRRAGLGPMNSKMSGASMTIMWVRSLYCLTNVCLVFYARHNGIGLFARMSLEPGEIDRWGEEIVVAKNTPDHIQPSGVSRC